MGTTGVEGAVEAISCVGLKSRSRSGLGAGEIGRDGADGGAEASAGLLELPMFSNRARSEETGLIDEPSGPSPLGGSMMVEELLLDGGVEGRYYPLHPRRARLVHQGINARALGFRVRKRCQAG